MRRVTIIAAAHPPRKEAIVQWWQRSKAKAQTTEQNAARQNSSTVRGGMMKSLIYGIPRVAAACRHQRVPPVTLISRAWVSELTADEPQHMVGSDGSLAAKHVKIPYLTEAQKKDIYCMFMTKPEKWTFTALAQRYRANVERIRAVVHLMHTRCDLMRKLGLGVRIVSSSNPHDPPQLSVEIPKLSKALYDLHMAESALSTADLLAKFNETATSEADKLHISEAEAAQILSNLKDHFRREQNAADYEAYVMQMLEELKADGANVSFQEVPLASRNENYFELYYPKVLKDEDFEDEKKKLLQKVKDETKAQFNPATIEHVTEQYEQSQKKPHAALTAQKTSPTRWKLAFKDLSGAKKKANPNTFIPSTIRTRTGE